LSFAWHCPQHSIATNERRVAGIELDLPARDRTIGAAADASSAVTICVNVFESPATIIDVATVKGFHEAVGSWGHDQAPSLEVSRSTLPLDLEPAAPL
jgi:hypothetical protein